MLSNKMKSRHFQTETNSDKTNLKVEINTGDYESISSRSKERGEGREEK